MRKVPHEVPVVRRGDRDAARPITPTPTGARPVRGLPAAARLHRQHLVLPELLAATGRACTEALAAARVDGRMTALLLALAVSHLAWWGVAIVQSRQNVGLSARLHQQAAELSELRALLVQQHAVISQVLAGLPAHRSH